MICGQEPPFSPTMSRLYVDIESATKAMGQLSKGREFAIEDREILGGFDRMNGSKRHAAYLA